MTAFHGAKGAILIGDRLVALLRDDRPGLAFAGCWDLPGGGREGRETPAETFAREVWEELGLDLGAAEALWARAFSSGTDPGQVAWFFVLRLPAGLAPSIRLGAEGQGWGLMRPKTFVTLPRAVPFLRRRLALAMLEIGGVRTGAL